jgi:flagellar motor switch protein FliN
MIDNQLSDLLTKAEEALNSILEPAAGEAPHAVRAYPLETFCDDDAAAGERLVLRIELGRTRLSLDDASQLRSGSVLPLDQLAGEPVNVYAGKRLVARGDAIVVDDKLGVRLVELIR